MARDPFKHPPRPPAAAEVRQTAALTRIYPVPLASLANVWGVPLAALLVLQERFPPLPHPSTHPQLPLTHPSPFASLASPPTTTSFHRVPAAAAAATATTHATPPAPSQASHPLSSHPQTSATSTTHTSDTTTTTAAMTSSSPRAAKPAEPSPGPINWQDFYHSVIASQSACGRADPHHPETRLFKVLLQVDAALAIRQAIASQAAREPLVKRTNCPCDGRHHQQFGVGVPEDHSDVHTDARMQVDDKHSLLATDNDCCCAEQRFLVPSLSNSLSCCSFTSCSSASPSSSLSLVSSSPSVSPASPRRWAASCSCSKPTKVMPTSPLRTNAWSSTMVSRQALCLVLSQALFCDKSPRFISGADRRVVLAAAMFSIDPDKHRSRFPLSFLRGVGLCSAIRRLEYNGDLVGCLASLDSRYFSPLLRDLSNVLNDAGERDGEAYGPRKVSSSNKGFLGEEAWPKPNACEDCAIETGDPIISKGAVLRYCQQKEILSRRSIHAVFARHGSRVVLAEWVAARAQMSSSSSSSAISVGSMCSSALGIFETPTSPIMDISTLFSLDTKTAAAPAKGTSENGRRRPKRGSPRIEKTLAATSAGLMNRGDESRPRRLPGLPSTPPPPRPSGACRRSTREKEDKRKRRAERTDDGVSGERGERRAEVMSCADFARFYLAVLNLSTDAGVRYWFRVLDIDGDELLGLHDILHFASDRYGRTTSMAMMSSPSVFLQWATTSGFVQMEEVRDGRHMRTPVCSTAGYAADPGVGYGLLSLRIMLSLPKQDRDNILGSLLIRRTEDGPLGGVLNSSTTTTTSRSNISSVPMSSSISGGYSSGGESVLIASSENRRRRSMTTLDLTRMRGGGRMTGVPVTGSETETHDVNMPTLALDDLLS